MMGWQGKPIVEPDRCERCADKDAEIDRLRVALIRRLTPGEWGLIDKLARRDS